MIGNGDGGDRTIQKREKNDKTNRYARKRIKEARDELGLSQDDLAVPIHKTRGAVPDIERGRVQISVSDLVLLAGALQKPITFFFWAQYAGPQDDSLSAREKELISRFRQLQGHKELQSAAVRQVRALAEAAGKIEDIDLELYQQGKLPETPS